MAKCSVAVCRCCCSSCGRRCCWCVPLGWIRDAYLRTRTTHTVSIPATLSSICAEAMCAREHQLTHTHTHSLTNDTVAATRVVNNNGNNDEKIGKTVCCWFLVAVSPIAKSKSLWAAAVTTTTNFIFSNSTRRRRWFSLWLKVHTRVRTHTHSHSLTVLRA